MTNEKIANFQENVQFNDKQIYRYLIFFAVVLFGIAFLFNTPTEIFNGSIIILTSSANLITDYFEIANIGAGLVNASIMVFQALFMIKISRLRINGLLVAAVFTIAGFSLFGKNLYNSLPIILGVLCYCKIAKVSFRKLTPVALFGTALGPLVSEVSFSFGLSIYVGVFWGLFCGFLCGFFMPVLAKHFFCFHKGFSLYNIGFTSGIIATFLTAIFRSFGSEIDSVYLVSRGNNKPFAIFLFSLFLLTFLLGLKFNNYSFKGFGELMKESGRGRTDYLEKYQHGLVLINMSFLGILATLYILLVGGQLNGPTIGGIFTVTGFGASGKHLKNVIPVLIGVFLVAYFSVHDISSTTALLAALFGTTLAPISGYYGVVAGIITGGLHIIFTTNMSFIHAGMNLYNNGFSGGFVAALMVPILEKIRQKTSKNEKNEDIIYSDVEIAE